MRTGSLRGAPLAWLVSAHYAGPAGPYSAVGITGSWRKKLQTRKCGSACPNCAIFSPHCYGEGGTALNTCCIGPSGEDDISFAPCTATIESANRLCRSSIYNCSTRSRERAFAPAKPMRRLRLCIRPPKTDLGASLPASCVPEERPCNFQSLEWKALSECTALRMHPPHTCQGSPGNICLGPYR
jgi:hypothetical protein